MEITKRTTADIVTLSLSGKLDSTTAKTFEETILGGIESGDRRLVIDLAQLDYISSAGLRVFALAGKRLKNANGKIVLCAFKKTIPYNTLNRIPDPVREVFDIAGFSSDFSHLRLPRRGDRGTSSVNMSALQFRSEIRRLDNFAGIRLKEWAGSQ